MKKVSLLKCRDYSSKALKDKIINGLCNIGFDLNDFKNSRIIIKPNLLSPTEPEKAVITHPEFFRAVVQVVKKYGGIPVLVESPSIFSLEKVIKKVGYKEIIDEENVEVADVKQTAKLYNVKGKSYKQFDISREFHNADIILNLPKLKTHGLTYITAAVKNLFGAIPGLSKSKWHIKARSKERFSEFLLDLYGGFLNGFNDTKRMIHIVDAVIGMEGEGPGPVGRPRRIGAVITGTDAIAVDFVAVNLIGLDVNKVFTITFGAQRNLGSASFDEIEVVGDKIEDLRINDFIPPSSSFLPNLTVWPFTHNAFRNLFTEKPVPQDGKCTLCYQCKTICPSEAISEKTDGKKKIPVYDYNKCIRCYCCMEICPEAAITLKKGALQKLMNWNV